MDINSEWDNDGGIKSTKYPIVQFRTKYGKTIRQKLDHGESNFIGQNIPIIYTEKNNKFEIVTNSNFWLIKFPLGMVIIGFTILLIILILVFKI